MHVMLPAREKWSNYIVIIRSLTRPCKNSSFRLRPDSNCIYCKTMQNPIIAKHSICNRTVARKSSIVELCVCAGGWTFVHRGFDIQIKQKFHWFTDLQWFIFQFEGAWSFVWGAKPTKALPWRRDWFAKYIFYNIRGLIVRLSKVSHGNYQGWSARCCWP